MRYCKLDVNSKLKRPRIFKILRHSPFIDHMFST